MIGGNVAEQTHHRVTETQRRPEEKKEQESGKQPCGIFLFPSLPTSLCLRASVVNPNALFSLSARPLTSRARALYVLALQRAEVAAEDMPYLVFARIVAVALNTNNGHVTSVSAYVAATASGQK